MPPALYNCRTGETYASREEMLTQRKHRHNIEKKIKYWRTHYGYDLNANDYEQFNKHVKVIKRIHKIHQFVCKFNKNNLKKSDIKTYVDNYKVINDALPIQAYLQTLKKIDEPIIIEFE